MYGSPPVPAMNLIDLGTTPFLYPALAPLWITVDSLHCKFGSRMTQVIEKLDASKSVDTVAPADVRSLPLGWPDRRFPAASTQEPYMTSPFLDASMVWTDVGDVGMPRGGRKGTRFRLAPTSPMIVLVHWGDFCSCRRAAICTKHVTDGARSPRKAQTSRRLSLSLNADLVPYE